MDMAERILHTSPHPLRGRLIRMPDNWVTGHRQYGRLVPAQFVVVDWYDRVTGRAWKDMLTPTVIVYAIRVGAARLPEDDEVVFGLDERGFATLLHSTYELSHGIPYGWLQV